VGEGAEPVVREVGVGDGGVVGVGEGRAVPGRIVAEGPGAGALGDAGLAVGVVVATYASARILGFSSGFRP